MSTKTEQHEIQVCVDCLFMLANGEIGDTASAEQNAAHIARMAGHWGNGWELFLGSDDEGSFSWSSCEGCGSTLGGDRQTAYAIRRESI
jgi:hypothetical protein